MKTLLERAALIASLALTAGALGAPAHGASLLTSASGYSGPVLKLGEYDGGAFTFTTGPVTLPGGITYSSGSSNSALGDGVYFLGTNGDSLNSYIVGANDPDAAVTLTFATPVASFGADFNYSPGTGSDPTISAFGVNGDLIASYDLADLAPISTPGEVNVFAFRGIDGDGAPIASIAFSGDYIIAEGDGIVPEPTTWAMMLLGFSALGLALRARRQRLAA
jgi:hypothetical protein